MRKSLRNVTRQLQFPYKISC